MTEPTHVTIGTPQAARQRDNQAPSTSTRREATGVRCWSASTPPRWPRATCRRPAPPTCRQPLWLAPLAGPISWPWPPSAWAAVAGSRWPVRPPAGDLLEEARRALGAGPPALLARVTARLSVALSLSGAEERRLALSEEALAVARTQETRRSWPMPSPPTATLSPGRPTPSGGSRSPARSWSWPPRSATVPPSCWADGCGSSPSWS